MKWYWGNPVLMVVDDSRSSLLSSYQPAVKLRCPLIYVQEGSVSTVTDPTPPRGYAYETCGLCKGTGLSELFPDAPCPPCGSRGKVLVYQPSVRCPRCKGERKASENVKYGLRLCVVCHGAGWQLRGNA